MTTPDAFPLEPTPIRVSDEVLDDLRARLTLTRPPLDERNADWSYGVPDSYLRPEIAGELSVSVNTVNTHVRRIYAKLGADDRSAAVHHARKLQLLSAGCKH
jgi:FixJ family two-component response regulator